MEVFARRRFRSDAAGARILPEEFNRLVAEGASTREIARILGISKSSAHYTLKALGIRLPNRLSFSKEKRSRPISTDLFTPPLSAEASWLLGLLLTDGSAGDNGRLTLNLADKDGAEQAAQIIGFGSIRRVEPRHNTKAVMWSYTACSVRLIERLAVFGVVPRKIYNLVFPDTAGLSLPDLVRGLWDGDGSWMIDRRDGTLRAGFYSASFPFITTLRSHCAEITGSKAKIRQDRGRQFWSLAYQGAPAMALARWMYVNGPARYLARKRALIEPFL